MNEGTFGFSPVLLLGPPGSGKSRLAQALAEAFGAPFLRVDRAGESDAREFLGTGAGWSSERPALPTRFLAEIDIANPVVFIDEIDKEKVDSRNGSVSRGLQPMLEPRPPGHGAIRSCSSRTISRRSAGSWQLTI